MDSQAFLTTMDKFQQPPVYMNPAELGKYWAEAYVDAGKQVSAYIKKQ
jgi:hypothetical protein